MSSKLLLMLCSFATFAALTGCGGGGGGSTVTGGSATGTSTTTTTTTTTTSTSTSTSTSTTGSALDIANAAAAKLSAVVNLSSNTVQLSWQDTFPAGSSYQVQAQGADGSFSSVQTVQGAGGTGLPMQWQRAVTGSSVFRVQALVSGRVVSLTTAQGQTSVSVAIPASSMQIVANQIEPVSGNVQLSISGSGSAAAGNWYVDLNFIGTSASSTESAVLWDTTSITNGAHQILARIPFGADTYVEVRRTIQVANSSLIVTPHVIGVTGTVSVAIEASSPNGIKSVSALLDGSPLGTLQAPNTCYAVIKTNPTTACILQFLPFIFNAFTFTLNSASIGSGTHTMVVTATDGAGQIQKTTVLVPISNAPAISLGSPIDGAFAAGVLTLSGSVASDKAGSGTVTASLGSVQFLQSNSTNFAGAFDLTGLAPGAYTLTVLAVDSSGASSVVQQSVIVTSSAAPAYQYQLSLGAGGSLLSAEGNAILYRAADASVRLRNTVSAAETVLAGAAGIASSTRWQVSNGIVYAQGKGSDCASACIYQWAADGSIRNLTALNPNPLPSNGYDLYPVARAGFVVWANQPVSATGTYTLYNAATQGFTRIAPASNVSLVGNTQFDFAVTAGNVNLFYWGQTGGSGTSSNWDVFQWMSSTQTSTALSNGGAANLYPATDGARVAWSRNPAGNASQPSTLVVQPVSGGSGTVVSTGMQNFLMADGVLTWIETAGATRALKASSASGNQTLSIQTTSLLYDAAGGYVLYGEQGKAYSWKASSGASALLLDVAPNQLIINGSVVYIVIGNAKAVYKVVLN